VAATIVMTVLGVAGCGGSSPTSTSHTVTSATVTTPVSGPAKDCVFKVHGSRLRQGYQGLVYQTRYGSRLGAAAIRGCWEQVQVPSSFGKPQDSRIELVKAPGSASDPYRPSTSVMRVELRPFDGGGPAGDVTDTSGYRANRAEVYARLGDITTPPQDWPDPVNSTRWYGYALYVPPGFPTSDQLTHWLVLTQWKGLYSGSPAVAVGIKNQKLVLAGQHFNQKLARLDPGHWIQLRIGIHFSPVPADGWITVSIDGHVVLPVTHGATMNTYYDQDKHAQLVDPSYLKQGIYRSDTWHQTQVLYFGPLSIGTDAASVG
jgi:hypothetical protein